MKTYSTMAAWLNITTKLLFSFVALFILAVLLVNAETENKKSDFLPKAEFLVVLDWEDGSQNDIDLWIKDPTGAIVGYPRKQSGAAFLDVDNLGRGTNAYIGADGAEHEAESRREIITVRQIIPGPWSVSVHYFSGRGPNKATVTILKMNPYAQVLLRKVELDTVKQEIGIASIEMDGDGNVISVTPDSQPFVNHYMSGQS